MSFDLLSNFTIEQKGEQDIRIVTCGEGMSNFTGMLVTSVDDKKLPPMVVFKRNMIPKEPFSSRINIMANVKREDWYFDDDILDLYYLEKTASLIF
ncbi:hypothetical protein MXB_2976 [Myxobolus squamalis]|nr:hypothetical protein MXB_2976 [Myxobolus squamalis]